MEGMIMPIGKAYAPKRKKTDRDDEDQMYTPMPSNAYGLQGSTGLEGMMLMPPGMMERAAQSYSNMLSPRTLNYAAPRMPMQSMTGMQRYGPMPQAMGPQIPGMSNMNIQYTAEDGSVYSIGFSTNPENKAKALDGALGYLKSVILAEGKGYKGNYAGNSGKAGPAYAGGGRAGGYAGAGGKGGGGGK